MWEVVLVEEVEAWLLGLDDVSYERVAAAIDKLADDGPSRYEQALPLAEQRYGRWERGE